jgi:hypothetical protein
VDPAQIEAQIGISLEKARKLRHDAVARDPVGYADDQRAGWPHATRAQVGFSRSQVCNRLRADSVILRSVRGQRHPAGSTPKQRRSELVLERRDHLRNRRRADVELARCARETARFDDLHQVLHATQLVHGRSPRLKKRLMLH